MIAKFDVGALVGIVGVSYNGLSDDGHLLNGGYCDVGCQCGASPPAHHMLLLYMGSDYNYKHFESIHWFLTQTGERCWRYSTEHLILVSSHDGML